uniref:Uncharacterized protein n=1 Tax=Opuntia streptacantha TaxID=393608 RepID=A0A7C9FPY0_OPUST
MLSSLAELLIEDRSAHPKLLNSPLFATVAIDIQGAVLLQQLPGNAGMHGNTKVAGLEASEDPLHQLLQVHCLRVVTHCFEASIAEPVFWGDVNGGDSRSFNSIHRVSAGIEIKVAYLRVRKDLPDPGFFRHFSS